MESIPQSDRHRGVVARSTGSWYEVVVGDTIVSSRLPGRFRMTESEVTSPIAVGDGVTVALQEDGSGLITDLGERTNKLSRRAAGHRAPVEHVLAANIDRVVILQSIDRPRFNTGFVDRVLVMAEVEEIPSAIVLNKSDLLVDRLREDVEDAADMYRSIGYPVVYVSALTGLGFDDFVATLEGRRSLLIGPSGVGKSTLLNRVEPGLDIPTAEVSAKTKKGRHTTTFAELHMLDARTSVIDTPGIREFGIWDVAPEDLGSFFLEFRPHAPHCRYYNCLHDHEPGCAVKSALERGDVHERRYASYLNILFDLQTA